MADPSLLSESNFCRLCAEENQNGIFIFSTGENSSSNLKDLINNYLPMMVEKDDTFPKTICPGCHIQLEATKCFMDLIVTGQSKLRNMYKYQIKQDNLETDYLNELSNSPLYLINHKLKLRVDGLDKPKRKRGRPAKKLQEEKLDYLYENVEESQENEKMEEEIGTDGRKKRRIRAPARFNDVVQGKELDDILKKEGVLDEEGTGLSRNNEQIAPYANDLIIGRTEGDCGEDLGQPIFIKRKKLDNFKKLEIRKCICQICPKIFIHEINYKQHMKCHENDGIKVEIMNKEESQIHLNKDDSAISLKLAETMETRITDDFIKKENPCFESTSKINNCPKCLKNFPSQETLTRHTSEQCKEKKFPCKICGKVLQHSSSLLYHKEIEHNNNRFVCNKCNRKFKHRQLLQRHQIVHSDDRPFICPICNATFKTLPNLLNHEGVHTLEKRFECTECNQKFAHKTSLSLHQRWHEGKKPYTCDVCQKSFSQNGNLLEHKRIHTGEKPFFCEVCGKNFTTSSQLRIHSKRHTGEKPWTCEICSKNFLHKDAYKLHLRRHFNDRQHVCSTCGKAFIDRWALIKHQRIHTGEKPFKCQHCRKAFADNSNLQKHQKMHKFMNNKTDLNKITESSSNSIQLTQLIDQQGNPISITTQDGQTIPVVTSGGDDSNLQGLMPDGSLVPIEISATQERDFSEEITEDLQEISNTEVLTSGSNLSPNFQFLTNNVGEEVCLVTYSIEEDGALTQELILESALVQN